MTIIEDQTVDVVDVGFPPPPSPDITLSFKDALELMRVVRAVADELVPVPHAEQARARLEACADVVDTAVQIAGWAS